MSYSLLWSVLAAVVAGLLSAQASMYAQREQVRSECFARIEETKKELIASRVEEMKHVVTIERWLEERRQERERSATEFLGLMQAIQKLQLSVKH